MRRSLKRWKKGIQVKLKRNENQRGRKRQSGQRNKGEVMVGFKAKFGKDVTLASHLSVLEKTSPETLSLMFGEVSKRLSPVGRTKVELAPLSSQTLVWVYWPSQ